MKTRRELLSFVVVAAAATMMSHPLGAADHTPVFSNGVVGELSAIEGLGKEDGLMPSTGTGKLSDDMLANRFWDSSPARIKSKDCSPGWERYRDSPGFGYPPSHLHHHLSGTRNRADQV